MPKAPQHAFRGKSLEDAINLLSAEFADREHSFHSAHEHLLDFRQHCIRWALEGFARDLEAVYPDRSALVTVASIVRAIRVSTNKYESGEL